MKTSLAYSFQGKKCNISIDMWHMLVFYWEQWAECLFLQLFKRRNVATVEEDGTLEDDGMSDSGYLESQANNMDQITVRKIKQ